MHSTFPNRGLTSPLHLAAIVLAAGASSRMGRFKPLLPLGGVAALERSVEVFRQAGIEDIWVVLGCRAEDLHPIVERCGVRCIENLHWQEGMYSSIAAAAQAITDDVDGAFVLPADTPLVRSHTIRQLAEAFFESPRSIVYPVFDGRRGHPPLVSNMILKQVAAGAVGPLSAVLAAQDGNARDVMVADEAIHLDMDWPSDFDALQLIAARRDIPSPMECEALLAEYRVPEAVIRHSRAVADVASRIAEAMVATGITVDRELACAGGLLHDIAKGRPRHAEIGASLLRSRGMTRVAQVVETHTEILFQGIVDEGAIVYLADKLIAGETLVTVEERFRAAFDRFVNQPDALASALRRREDAERIAAEIESMLSMPLTVILPDPRRIVSVALEVPQ